MRGSEVDTEVLSSLVKRKVAESANLREAAKAAGVSPATLSRVQRGGHTPDRDALAAIARWLQVPIDKLLAEPPPVDQTTPEMSTVEKIEVHLRADPNLSAKAAATLADVFRALYEELAARQQGASHP
jgi:transcriptional regulator with XRE-family HTH domain